MSKRAVRPNAGPLQVLRQSDVLVLLSVHRSTLWRWIRSGQFPRPIRLARSAAYGWFRKDVESWLLSQPRQVEDNRESVA